MSKRTQSILKFLFYLCGLDVDFSALKPHTRHPDDLVFLPYSSGTTGLPKGVMLSHNNIAVNCEQLNVKLGESPLVKETTADFQEVSLSVLPFFHIYGLTVLMIAKLALGTKIVTLPSFKPKTFLNATRDYKATMLHLVPPISESNWIYDLIRTIMTNIFALQSCFWAATTR